MAALAPKAGPGPGRAVTSAADVLKGLLTSLPVSPWRQGVLGNLLGEAGSAQALGCGPASEAPTPGARGAGAECLCLRAPPCAGSPVA